MESPYLRRMRSAESWIGVSGFLISWAMRRATSAQAVRALRADQLGHVVEGHDEALRLLVLAFAGDAHGEIALRALAPLA